MASNQYIDLALTSLVQDYGKSAIFTGEANYGLKYISSYLNELPSQSCVLEIGSGPCILLSHLTKCYPDLHFEGIEPHSESFSFFERYIVNLSKVVPINLFRGSFEDFKSSKKFDLIFLINVFEHIGPWEECLLFIKKTLAPNGRCVILCPNYAFPYESHFGLPIIISKDFTYKILKSKIDHYENTYQSHGLWRSLNFITYTKLKKVAEKNGLVVNYNPQIMDDLFNRLLTDEEFYKRHRLFALPVKILLKAGLLRIVTGWPFMQRFLPYMHLELSLKNERDA